MADTADIKELVRLILSNCRYGFVNPATGRVHVYTGFKGLGRPKKKTQRERKESAAAARIAILISKNVNEGEREILSGRDGRRSFPRGSAISRVRYVTPFGLAGTVYALMLETAARENVQRPSFAQLESPLRIGHCTEPRDYTRRGTRPLSSFAAGKFRNILSVWHEFNWLI